MNAMTKDETLQLWLQQGIALQQDGDNEAAMALFELVLEADPKNVAANYSLCAIATAQGRYNEALDYVSTALNSMPQFALGQMAHSVVLYHLGRSDEAMRAVQTALALDPALPGAQAHMDTVRVLQATTANNPASRNPEVLALNHKAIDMQAQGQHAEAEALLRQALSLEPSNFFTLYSLGVSRSAQTDSPGALVFFNQACEASPQQPLGYFAKAKTLHDLGLAEAALEAYDQAIAADPHYLEAYTNKAALLQRINRHHDALMCLTAATDINPLHVRALEGQGLLLGQYKEYTLATRSFAQALQVDPNYPYGEGLLMGARLNNCDWTDFDAAKARIIAGIEAGKPVCGPLTIMALTDDAAIIRKCTELYAADKFRPAATPLWTGEKYTHRKKRVGFVSGDFRVHPVGYLLIGLLENFDKSQFELTGFFTGVSDNSDLWKRYRCAFDHYIDCHSKTSLEVAQLMRAMEMDVVIDLSGYTEGTRLDVLAHRPAPTQMTYLGFPGTLGLPYIDYLISDPRIIPDELEQHYSEKILKLPHCYLPRDNSVVPSPETPKRSYFGLPEEGVVFCSFNHDYKINPPMFKVWMDLLKEVPGSVLWLMKLNEGAHTNLTQSARDLGVDPERIIFASRLPRVEDHLARYRLADVFIDTFPYNGHTTAGDALRAGLPVVSLCGGSFASRVAASLLHDVGMPELACYSFQEYHDKIFKISTDSQYKQKIKATITSHINSKAWPIDNKTLANEFMENISKIH